MCDIILYFSGAKLRRFDGLGINEKPLKIGKKGTFWRFFSNFAAKKGIMQSQLITVLPQSIDSSIHAIDHGAVYLCQEGTAEVGINFDRWRVEKDTAVIFFPGDVVQWHGVSGDFSARVIRYSAELLRSASVNMEHSIYSRLRGERMCKRRDVVEHVLKNMFKILDFYFSDDLIRDTDSIVDAQLHSFFMGFNDYITNLNNDSATLEASRTDTLFNQFMELVQTEYRQSHEAIWFADRLHISRKYLGVIVKKRTGVTPKRIIDECITLQLQLALRTTQKPMKQIAAEFHFADVSVMTRYFKTHTGINPLKYRNS